jgi:hypothetical protein
VAFAAAGRNFMQLDSVIHGALLHEAKEVGNCFEAGKGVIANRHMATSLPFAKTMDSRGFTPSDIVISDKPFEVQSLGYSTRKPNSLSV